MLGIVPLVIQVGLGYSGGSNMLGVAPLVIQVGLGYSGGSNVLGVAPLLIQVGLGYSGGSNMLGVAPLLSRWVQHIGCCSPCYPVDLACCLWLYVCGWV